MTSREYFLKQAETALRLARSSTDEEFAQRLLGLAVEFKRKADAAENDPPFMATASFSPSINRLLHSR
jgi:hypothetical protein